MGMISDEVVRMRRPKTRLLTGSSTERFNQTTVGWMNAPAAVKYAAT